MAGSAPSQPAKSPPSEEKDAGAKEEPRAEGQYKMKSSSADPMLRASRVAIGLPSEPAPMASVLVRKDTIWVGTTRSAAEPVTIPAGTDQATKLADALRALKQLPAFASRRDIEIAAEDDAVYRQLVAAIDAAGKAGFTDWNVVASASLSSLPQP